jgi:mono/diheme cytochrome c family protein
VINKPERLWVFDTQAYLEIFATSREDALRQVEYYEEQTGMDFVLHPEWEIYQRERMTNAEAAVAEAVAATERAGIAAAFKADAAVRAAKFKAAKRKAGVLAGAKQVTRVCPSCHGNGYRTRPELRQCGRCQSSGEVNRPTTLRDILENAREEIAAR